MQWTFATIQLAVKGLKNDLVQKLKLFLKHKKEKYNGNVF